jgi:hypothetical protein
MAALAIASRSLSRELAIGTTSRSGHLEPLREVAAAVGS